MDIGAYHVLQLQIACDPADTRRVMPRIAAGVELVLDVGCGAGQTLIASSLARHVTAVGIDCDIEALRLGRRIDSRIDFVCCRGEQLPLAGDAFDMVIARVSLPYMDTRVTLAEMARVLRPGGTMWLALHPLSQALAALVAAVDGLDPKMALHRLFVLANGACSHWLGCEIASPLSGSRESFQTPARMRSRLEALGLEKIEIRTQPFFVVTAQKADNADAP